MNNDLSKLLSILNNESEPSDKCAELKTNIASNDKIINIELNEKLIRIPLVTYCLKVSSCLLSFKIIPYKIPRKPTKAVYTAGIVEKKDRNASGETTPFPTICKG